MLLTLRLRSFYFSHNVGNFYGFSNMAVLKWLESSRFLFKKEVAPVSYVKGFCTKERTKSNLDIILEERDKIDIDTKLRYMKSKAYKTTYGDLPVWTVYVRNFKGGFAPAPRPNCIVAGRFISRNPCPMCRDKYLIADYRNVDLLKQFITPFGGEIISNRKTGVCQRQQFNLLVAINKAREIGLLSFPVPFRRYDYSIYKEQ